MNKVKRLSGNKINYNEVYAISKTKKNHYLFGPIEYYEEFIKIEKLLKNKNKNKFNEKYISEENDLNNVEEIVISI